MVAQLDEHDTEPWFKAMIAAIRERLVSSQDQNYSGLEYLLDLEEARARDLWFVEFYPYPILMEDGDEGDVLVIPQFSVDVIGLLEIFESVSELRYNLNDYQSASLIQGTHLLLRGRYDGHSILLCIYAESDPDEQPVFRIRQDGSKEFLDDQE